VQQNWRPIVKAHKENSVKGIEGMKEPRPAKKKNGKKSTKNYVSLRYDLLPLNLFSLAFSSKGRAKEKPCGWDGNFV